MRIQFSSVTGGTGIVATTDYFVRDVTANTFKLAASRGGAAIDLTASNITASTFKNEVYPVIVLGKASIAFGDVSTLSYHGYSGDGPGNELGQLSASGFKGILGGKVLSFAETADGAGANSTARDRIYTFTVMSGQSA